MTHIRYSTFARVVSACFLLLLLAPAMGAEVAKPQLPPPPPPPDIPSKAHILIDYDSGQILADYNANQRLEPASLTKMMSVDIVFQEITAGHVKFDDQVPISEKAWRTGGSRTFARVGKSFRLEDLLKGAIIQSGNDATVALAEHVAGSEQTFVAMMNARAKKLEMTGSHFMNATGLPDPDHYSTAADMAKLAAATIREFPELYKFYSLKEFEFNNIKQPNRNLLLARDSSVDGIKTGHTAEAGFCLVASAKRNGQRLISVLMGAKSLAARAADSLALLNYGFRFYETHKLYDKHQVLGKVRVWRGESGEVGAGPAQAVYVTVPRQQYQYLDLKLEIAPFLAAPVTADQQVGRVLIHLGDKQLAEVPLVALSGSATGGMFRYLMDTVLQWFN